MKVIGSLLVVGGVLYAAARAIIQLRARDERQASTSPAVVPFALVPATHFVPDDLEELGRLHRSRSTIG